jgi:streptogramin lyase
MIMAVRSVSLVAAALVGVLAAAAATNNAPNSQPNPYHRVDNFFKLPPGRTMGSSSAVGVDHQGHIWIAERCGANSCANSKLDPVMEFDAGGNFIKAFGGGMMVFPHGFFIDQADHIWVTDAQLGEGKGDDVLEFDQNGKLLRTLGKPGIAGNGTDSFSEPSAVLVAPNGDIFVGDGHEEGKGNARIVKFDKSGKFIMQWGSHGSGPGQIEVPHTLAMDSRGRLFVGDRGNSRIQIFSQDGKLLDTWTQFSRPSGLYIDQNDVLYVTDSESRNAVGYGHHPGWTRGIRIGGAKDGVVSAFIPDPALDPEHEATTGAEGITADGHGAVYGAEVGPKDVVKYEKK